jgi:hypothetical protein
MARFQIEEFYGERIVATTSAEAPDALTAAETPDWKGDLYQSLERALVSSRRRMGRHRPRIQHCRGAPEDFVKSAPKPR